MELVSNVNFFLGALTVAGQIAIAAVVVLLVLRKENVLRRLIFAYALPLAFAVVVMATAGSLFYSEVAGYEPCKLCWFQRIFMYPQVLLLGIALVKKDRSAARYALLLSAIGAVIAGYHYLLQLGVAPALPCSAVGYSVSCSQRFVMQFGYITIPMMALTAFALTGLVSALSLKFNKTQPQEIEG